MLELLGRRQKELLKLLLRQKHGLTVDELGTQLQITRNAVRQHLAALQGDGLVESGAVQATAGRPTQLYVLSPKGQALFPRQYAWLVQLMLDSVKQESGGDSLRRRLSAMGVSVGEALKTQHPGLRSRRDKIFKLAELMEHLGYNTAATSVLDPTVISANNCVFHEVALRDPDVCQFDLALLSTFTDGKVEHEECMAKGGHCCRFKFIDERDPAVR